jgi:CRISPR-associated protein Cas2
MQRLVLLYDIVNDRARSKVADACLDYGLDRIQYSAFMGSLSRIQQQELMYRIEDILDGKTANVKLITIPEQAWQARLEIDTQGEEEDIPTVKVEQPF